jgi:hypothetical protein
LTIFQGRNTKMPFKSVVEMYVVFKAALLAFKQIKRQPYLYFDTFTFCI